MPWCDSCDVYVEAVDSGSDDSCPTCDGELDTADIAAGATDSIKAPWHFKLMLALLIGYLGWRLIQFVIWLAA